MKKYIIMIIIILVSILIGFSSYYIYSSNHSENSVDDLQTKANEEIMYLDTTIVSMMNKLNNISYANYKIVEEKVPAEEENTQTSSTGNKGGTSKSGNTSSGEDSGGQSQGSSQGNESNTVTNMNMNYSSILVNPNKTIDWDTIKKETEKMYRSWITVLIDLNTLNVNQDNLLKYSTTLDSLTKAVQKKDKKETLNQLANLYSLIVSYNKEVSKDNQKNSILDTKSNILYAYALAEGDKWQDMKNHIKKAQSAYNNVINSNLQNNQNVSNINKAYVLLNEIDKGIDTKDKSIFYIKYKNLMQELEVLEG